MIPLGWTEALYGDGGLKYVNVQLAAVWPLAEAAARRNTNVESVITRVMFMGNLCKIVAPAENQMALEIRSVADLRRVLRNRG